ncbi:MAG: single-stranded DNA-binding protein [Saprospiraceae bacterium]
MINKVTLIGNLGRDPEVRRLENGAAVAKFSVATNENYKDKAGEWQTVTEWHEIIAWRNLAERAERDLKKGKLVFIEGKLTHRKYQDKDGNDRYITEVVANLIRLLEKRENSGSYNTNFPSAENAPAPQTEKTTAPSTTSSTAEAEDDLPF